MSPRKNGRSEVHRSRTKTIQECHSFSAQRLLAKHLTVTQEVSCGAVRSGTQIKAVRIDIRSLGQRRFGKTAAAVCEGQFKLAGNLSGVVS
jgi:hypothetical protein